jgi:hypothetical protein
VQSSSYSIIPNRKKREVKTWAKDIDGATEEDRGRAGRAAVSGGPTARQGDGVGPGGGGGAAAEHSGRRT